MSIRYHLAFWMMVILTFAAPASAQDSQMDSLLQVIANGKTDTLQVNTYLALSRKHFSSSPDEAIRYATLSLQLSKQLGFLRGQAFSYKNIGIAYFNRGLYIEAQLYYDSSLTVFQKLKDKIGVANIYNNMGNIYYQSGDDLRALELYMKQLVISEALHDTLRMSTALNNMAAVYNKKKSTTDLAIKSLQRALPLAEGMGNPEHIGTAAVNLGEIYFAAGNDSLAMKYFLQAIRAYQGSEYAPYALFDMGKLLVRQQEYGKAISILDSSFVLSQQLDSRQDMANSLIGLAQAYAGMGKNSVALEKYKQAEAIALELGSTDNQKEIYEGLTRVYAGLKDFRSAFLYQQKLIGVKDTIYNIESDKKLQGVQFSYEIDKKQNAINLLTKDQELKQKEISRQRLVKNGFIGGFAVMLLFAAVFFRQRNRISREKKRSDELLLNILPEETADELKATGTAKAKSFDLVTVMFTDFKNFTQASERLSAQELVNEINYCYSEFDRIITRYNIEKIKTIGDAYMCAGGIPVSNATHPTDVVKAGLEFQQFMAKYKAERIAADQPFFELRLGIHTGPVVAGIVGIKKFAYDIWGDTVNTASRMESSGEIGKVNISGDTYERIKDHFRCTHRGKVPAKNKGEIDMYFVEAVITA